MLKRMTLLSRRLDRSFEEFSAHWLGTHGEIVKRMPGVEGYIQNPVQCRLLTGLNPQDPFSFDGIVELWFSDAQAQAAAFASDAARELPLDELNFIRGITIFPVEEVPTFAAGFPVKVMVAARFNAGATATSAQTVALTATFAPFPEVNVAAINHLGQVGWREHLWHEPNPPQVMIELGLQNDAAALRLANRHELAVAHAEIVAAGGHLECYLIQPRRII